MNGAHSPDKLKRISVNLFRGHSYSLTYMHLTIEFDIMFPIKCCLAAIYVGCISCYSAVEACIYRVFYFLFTRIAVRLKQND